MKIRVSYMQITGCSAGEPPICKEKQAQIVVEKMSADSYLEIYKEIGEKYFWDTRTLMSKEELQKILESYFTEIFVLRINGDRLGMCEIDTSEFPEIEIKHFGLLARAQGKGLGRYFLDYVLRKLWARNPSRIWLHTDTNDHPNALPTYERAGFVKYMECEEES